MRPFALVTALTIVLLPQLAVASSDFACVGSYLPQGKWPSKRLKSEIAELVPGHLQFKTAEDLERDLRRATGSLSKAQAQRARGLESFRKLEFAAAARRLKEALELLQTHAALLENAQLSETLLDLGVARLHNKDTRGAREAFREAHRTGAPKQLATESFAPQVHKAYRRAIKQPPITYGTLAIASTPPGATAFLDGRKLGTTPRIIKRVATGSHTLRLTRAGYAPTASTVHIKRGRNFQRLRLPMPDLRATGRPKHETSTLEIETELGQVTGCRWIMTLQSNPDGLEMRLVDSEFAYLVYSASGIRPDRTRTHLRTMFAHVGRKAPKGLPGFSSPPSLQ